MNLVDIIVMLPGKWFLFVYILLAGSSLLFIRYFPKYVNPTKNFDLPSKIDSEFVKYTSSNYYQFLSYIITLLYCKKMIKLRVSSKRDNVSMERYSLSANQVKDLTYVEKEVLKTIPKSKVAISSYYESMVKNSDLKDELKEHYAEKLKEYGERGLVFNEEHVRNHKAISILLMAIILIIGGLKCYAAYTLHFPFMFLFFSMVAYLVGSVFLLNYKPGLTPQFLKYLETFKEKKGKIDYIRTDSDELLLATGDENFLTGNLQIAFVSFVAAYSLANSAAFGAASCSSGGCGGCGSSCGGGCGGCGGCGG